MFSAKAPLFSHLSNTLDGMWTIRAFMAEERFLRYFDTYQDRHTATSYMCLVVNRSAKPHFYFKLFALSHFTAFFKMSDIVNPTAALLAEKGS